MKCSVGFSDQILTPAQCDGSLLSYLVFLAGMYFRTGMSSYYCPHNPGI